MANRLLGKTVVICEDEGGTLMQLTKMMTKAGMVVLASVTDGEEAVNQVLRERPDIVLMDINLLGIDGTEAIRRINSTYATYRPCVVVVTAYADEDHRRKSAEAGAHGFVEKPFSAESLLAEIRRVLA